MTNKKFSYLAPISYQMMVWFYDVRRCPGNCKAAKTEMVWARDKIGRRNHSDTTGNSRRQLKKGQAEKDLD